VLDAKARWLGHRLHADVALALPGGLTLADAEGIASTLRRALLAHMPSLQTVNVTFGPPDMIFADTEGASAHDHHHAPAPFRVSCALAEGLLEIVDRPDGERMRLTVSRHAERLQVIVAIVLPPMPNDPRAYQSAAAPQTPHEFTAELLLSAGKRQEALPFHMTELLNPS
jgi:hypothetical protein